MQPGHACRVLQCPGDGGDRQRRGIAGEQRRGRAERLQIAEQALFDRQIFRHRFNHQRAVGQLLERVGAFEARQQCFGARGIGLAAVHPLPQAASELVDRALGGGGRDIEQPYRVAGGGGHLGDADAHGAGADHRHLAVKKGRVHGYFPLKFGVRLAKNALTPSR